MKNTFVVVGILMVLQWGYVQAGNYLLIPVYGRAKSETQVMCTGIYQAGRSAQLYAQCQGANGNMIPIIPSHVQDGSHYFRSMNNELAWGDQQGVMRIGRVDLSAQHHHDFKTIDGMQPADLDNVSFRADVVQPVTVISSGRGGPVRRDIVGAAPLQQAETSGPSTRTKPTRQAYHAGYMTGVVVSGVILLVSGVITTTNLIKTMVLAKKLKKDQNTGLRVRLEKEQTAAWRTVKKSGLCVVLSGIVTAACWKKRLVTTS